MASVLTAIPSGPRPPPQKGQEDPMGAHQRVLITGGSFGLGLAMARDFIARGAEVLVCARTEADLAEAARHNPGLKTLRADVSRGEDRHRLMAAATADGPLD